MAKKQKIIWYLWEMPHALPFDAARKFRSTPLQFLRTWTQSSMHYGRHSKEQLLFFQEYFDRLKRLKRSADGYAKLGLYNEIKVRIGADRVAALRGFMVGTTGAPLNAVDVARLIDCPDVPLVSAAIKTMRSIGLLIKTELTPDAMIHAIHHDITITPVLPDGSLCAMYDSRLPMQAPDDADETPVLPDGSDEAEEAPDTPEGHAPDKPQTGNVGGDEPPAEGPTKPPPIEDSDGISPATAGRAMGDIETVRRGDAETSAAQSDTTCGPDTVEQNKKTIPIETSAAQGDAETPSRYEGGPGQGKTYEVLPQNRKAAYVPVDVANAVGPSDQPRVGGSKIVDRGSEARGPQVAGSREAANGVPKDPTPDDYAPTIKAIAEHVCNALYPTDADLTIWGRKNDPPLVDTPRFRGKELESFASVLGRATVKLKNTGKPMSLCWHRAQEVAVSCANKTRKNAKADQRSIGASWTASMAHIIDQLCVRLSK